jgi:hypothetical protein
MGFDRVALLDIIANPPVSGDDGQAWLIAADVAGRSSQAMAAELKNLCSPSFPNSFLHCVCKKYMSAPSGHSWQCHAD